MASPPQQTEPVRVLPSGEHEIPASPDLEQYAAQPDQGERVGLHIVKRLCDLLDAHLEIESHPNRGTLFRIRLPIHWDTVS